MGAWSVYDRDTKQPIYTGLGYHRARYWASVHNHDERDDTGRRDRYELRTTCPFCKRVVPNPCRSNQFVEVCLKHAEAERKRREGITT